MSIILLLMLCENPGPIQIWAREEDDTEWVDLRKHPNSPVTIRSDFWHLGEAIEMAEKWIENCGPWSKVEITFEGARVWGN